MRTTDETRRMANSIRPVCWSRALRLRMFRRLVATRSPEKLDVIVKIAGTADERAAAFRLLHDEYVRRGLTDVEESGMRITPYHVLPTTRVFIAVQDDVVVGTLSLIRRTFLGVPAEAVFDLTALTEADDVIEEFSSLAVAHSLRSHGEILFALFRAAMKDSMQRAVDHWVATFHPRHRNLYVEILGFEPLEEREVRSHDFVNGAPAMGVCLELGRARQNLEILYGADTPGTPFTWFFGEEDGAVERVA